MSPVIPVTAESPPAVPAITEQAPVAAKPEEAIRVYGHNNLIYWWPVWVAGFLMAFLTCLDGHVMAVVPSGTTIESGQVLPGKDDRPRDVLVAPPGQPVPPLPGAGPDDVSPRLRMATNNDYGVVFVGILLLVIVSTNLLLRGLLSVLAVAGIAILILFVALMGWWDTVLVWFGGLDIRLNAGGYMAIAVPLFIIWALSTFVYDHYTYLIITRGQVRIRQAIGDGEIAVDTSGLLLEKRRNDLFRHWLLGLGTGDLHVKTSGPANLDFELPNVVFVGSKLSRIQDLIREKEVEQTTTKE